MPTLQTSTPPWRLQEQWGLKPASWRLRNSDSLLEDTNASVVFQGSHSSQVQEIPRLRKLVRRRWGAQAAVRCSMSVGKCRALSWQPSSLLGLLGKPTCALTWLKGPLPQNTCGGKKIILKRKLRPREFLLLTTLEVPQPGSLTGGGGKTCRHREYRKSLDGSLSQECQVLKMCF